jgi:hypothetical protein
LGFHNVDFNEEIGTEVIGAHCVDLRQRGVMLLLPPPLLLLLLMMMMMMMHLQRALGRVVVHHVCQLLQKLQRPINAQITTQYRF